MAHDVDPSTSTTQSLHQVQPITYRYQSIINVSRQSRSYLVTHDVGSPTHLVVPGLQLVRQIVDLNIRYKQKNMDNLSATSIKPGSIGSPLSPCITWCRRLPTWAVVYSELVRREEELRVFTQ